MNENITLEDLAPYLPYGLKSAQPFDKLTLIREVTLHNAMAFTDLSTSAKIILRPMDLEKPITIDNKEVIPIVELARIGKPEYDWEDYTCGDTVVAIEWDAVFGYDYGVFYIDMGHTDRNNKTVRAALGCANQYSLFKWLFKNKFDVFGLIQKGQAVDVYELEEKMIYERWKS